MKKLRITVEGKAYDVLVELIEPAGTAAPLAPPPASVASASVVAPVVAAPAPAAHGGSAPAGSIVSPLSGKVVAVLVQPGQAVTAGQQVATVEAMKMNTYVNAISAGTVAKVLVNPGDAVEENQALLVIS